jgi:hypothetical protein
MLEDDCDPAKGGVCYPTSPLTEFPHNLQLDLSTYPRNDQYFVSSRTNFIRTHDLLSLQSNLSSLCDATPFDHDYPVSPRFPVSATEAVVFLHIAMLGARYWNHDDGCLDTVPRGVIARSEVQSASDSKGGEGLSGADELAIPDDDHFRNVIQRATESCMTSFLALLIASTSSAVIDTTASTSSPLYISQLDRNARIVHFMLIILLCWLVVWGSTALRSTSSREGGIQKEEAETESARRKVLGERRPKWFIAILGTLPLVLAVGKHTMSGTMLGRVYDHYEQVVSRFRAGIKRHLSTEMKTERIC